LNSMCKVGKILVVGLQPNDSGKTTLCKALIYGFKENGVSPVPFKPHSGISYWSQFDTFQRSLMKSTLVCSDIIELEEAAQSQLPLEVLNPVNRLSNPGSSTGISEEQLVFQEFMAERFTHHNGVTHKSVYYLNGTINFSQIRDMKTFYLRIKKNAEKTLFIKRFQDLVKAYVDNFDRATSSCYRHIKDKPLVIESFNDAAYPFNGAEECDAVLCASPNIVLQFETSKYFEAIKSYGGEKSKLQLTVSDIYASSLVKNRFLIQPLNRNERNEPTKLTRNYSRTIKELKKNNRGPDFKS